MNRLQSISCLLSFFFFLLGANELSGRHIVGGEMTYECAGLDTLDNGEIFVNFDFILRVYRDCVQAGEGTVTDFDGRALIGIYESNGTFWNLFESIQPQLASTNEIDPNEGECVTLPPNLCVDQGIYTFSLSLPVRGSTYMVAYQRCCRNSTITNLVNPGNAGAVFSSVISPEAQSSCNSSAVFDQFPPLVICDGFEFNFDHGASDIDGDQIVYEFYNPLSAGGPIEGANNCFSPVPPVTACRPPFDEVRFLFPNYTAEAPVSGDPALSIDPNTGVISGTPNLQGRFVVGVRATEFRDGMIINEVRRDFQFNVTNCTPVVQAILGAEQRVGDREYLYNSCGDNVVEFDNESIQLDFINDYVWEFYVDQDTIMGSTRDLTVEFPGPGQYLGTMMLNPGSNCADTATITVNVFPPSFPDFSFDYDTCVAGPVSYMDLSTTDADIITDWAWDFGSETPSSNQQNPNATFGAPGINPVTLSITDNNNCVTDTTILVDWRPVPETIVVDPSSFTGCRPASIFFNNLSSPIDETYDIEWNFGDGNTSDEISPTHVYESPGTYTVSLDIISPIGCATERTYDSFITIDDKPDADFIFSPEMPTFFNRTVGFFDQSINAISWQWRIGDEAVLFDQNPIYTFQDTGFYDIQLVVRHPSGCTDTLVQTLDVLPIVDFHMPNAFTPNDDGKNDDFRGKGFTRSMTSFKMSIWTRWGDLIYETDDPNGAWNGKKDNIGADLPPGVYVYVVNYEGARGEREELKGFTTLIR